MIEIQSQRAPIIIDVEASGFGPGSYPIEVGLALEDGGTRCFLIQPAPDWTHWDPDAQSAHGIQRELLTAHGRPVAEVAEELNTLLHFKTVYSDAWGHDQSWLALLFDSADVPQRFRVDSLRCLLEEFHLPHWKNEKTEAQRELGLVRHRASSDALLLQRAVLQTLQREQNTESNHTRY